jgi:hypothetical protein
MHVKTVSVEYTRKLPGAQPYESNTVGMTLWADLDEGDDLDQVMHDLWATVTINVKAKVMGLDRGRLADWQTMYLGLPQRLQEAADMAGLTPAAESPAAESPAAESPAAQSPAAEQAVTRA